MKALLTGAASGALRRQSVPLGPHFTKPRPGLISREVASSSLNFMNQVTNQRSNASPFWTQLGNNGTQVDSDNTDGAYKTIYNDTSVTGGVIAYLIGCTANGAQVGWFEMTLDGAFFEVSIDVASGNRAVLGIGLLFENVYNASNGYEAGDITGSLNAGKTQFGTGGYPFCVAPWDRISSNGTPCLAYERTCLIRYKHVGASITGTANQERRVGVVHRK